MRLFSSRSAWYGHARIAGLRLACLAALLLAACTPGLNNNSIGSAGQTPQRLGQTPQGSLGSGQGGPVKVALLLPLTGRGAQVGQSMLNAAQMAVFEVADDRLILLPRDTGGTSAGAAAAARQAIQSGAQLILGPLFGGNAATVGAEARPSGISVLTFSSDRRQAAANVFVMGFTPEEQVERIADFAVKRGLRRFALLAPQDAYGNTVAAAIGTALRSKGAELVRAERYPAGSGDAALAAQRVAAQIGTFDALLIAEGPNLRAIANSLPQATVGSGGLQFLGTGLWDEPAIGRITQLHGGWFAGSEPRSRESFAARYASTYGRPPDAFVSAIAYDAVALAAVLARQGQGPGPIGTARLTQPDGFAGVTGVFRLLPNGLVEHGLAILEVTPAGPRVLEPAPVSFPDSIIGFGF